MQRPTEVVEVSEFLCYKYSAKKKTKKKRDGRFFGCGRPYEILWYTASSVFEGFKPAVHLMPTEGCKEVGRKSRHHILVAQANAQILA